jgi:hypothetical protein
MFWKEFVAVQDSLPALQLLLCTVLALVSHSLSSLEISLTEVHVPFLCMFASLQTAYWIWFVHPSVCMCSCVLLLRCFVPLTSFLFSSVLSSLHGLDFCHYWYMNRYFTIAMSSSVFILPLCYSKRIDFLKYVRWVSYILLGTNKEVNFLTNSSKVEYTIFSRIPHTFF